MEPDFLEERSGPLFKGRPREMVDLMRCCLPVERFVPYGRSAAPI